MPRYALLVEFPGYRVGDDGTVWSCRPVNGRGPLKDQWRLKKPTLKKKDRSPRCEVCLIKDGVLYHRKVGRLVMEAFVGRRPKGLQLCHKDDNPENNNLSNLYWGTPVQNMDDRQRNGNTRQGQHHHFAKLNDHEIRAIRSYEGKKTPAEVAAMFDVNHTTVRRIWKGHRGYKRR